MRRAFFLLVGPVFFWYLVAKVLTAILRRRPDRAWKPTGVRRIASGYDESKLTTRFQRERRQASYRRARAARTLDEIRQERTISQFETARAKRKAQG